LGSLVYSPKFGNPVKKWETELNRTFSKKDVQMAKKHRKKFSPFITMMEIQIKITLRFQLIPGSKTTIKNASTLENFGGFLKI
jgi:hypothetical protein